MGYLTQVKSGGKQYIYLYEYCGDQEYRSRREKNIYSFGQARLAYFKMRRWNKRFDEFPRELVERGYTKVDLNEWIKTIQTGKTKTGKIFDVDVRKCAVF